MRTELYDITLTRIALRRVALRTVRLGRGSGQVSPPQPPAGAFLLLESGGYLLTENGNRIKLENQ